MKRLPIAAALVTAAMLSGPALGAERTFDAGRFDSVEISAGIVAIVTAGTEFSLVAVADRDRDFDDLKIEHRGDRLVLTRPVRWSGLSLLRARPEITVRVGMPELVDIEASAGAVARVSGPLTGEIGAEASSGAVLEIEGFAAAGLVFAASSGARLEATGSCETLKAEASSGAELDAGDLICAEVDADASSGATIRAHAEDEVKAEASSGATIRISGDPAAHQIEESSGGDVRM